MFDHEIVGKVGRMSRKFMPNCSTHLALRLTSGMTNSNSVFWEERIGGLTDGSLAAEEST